MIAQSMMEKDERYPLMKEYLQQGLQNVYDEVKSWLFFYSEVCL